MAYAKRSRNWNFICYPESLPENWRGIIDDMHLEWVESPLHDKDINEDGEEKKEHYHITLLFPSVKTYEQVKAITDSLNSPIPVACQSVKGSIRYMVHKDNPEKHQYSWADIKCHGGAELDLLCKPSANEINATMDKIEDYIVLNKIDEYSRLIERLRKDDEGDMLVIVRTHTFHFNAYLKSRRMRAPKIDPKTAEVIEE